MQTFFAAQLMHALLDCSLNQARHVVLSPGSRHTPLVLACLQAQQARMHVVLDERSAAFFALGLARAQQQAVILLCTSGSAAAHYLPAVLEAHLSRIPLVIVTADRPAEAQECGAQQTVQQRHLFMGQLRWFYDTGGAHADQSARFWCWVASKALDAAERAYPGPVHINVPMREPLFVAGDVHQTATYHKRNSVCAARPCLHTSQLQHICRVLKQSPRGVIICGPRLPHIHEDVFAKQLFQLAQQLGYPVFAEPASQLRFGFKEQPSLVSFYDLILRQHDFEVDVIVRFGHIPTSKILQQWMIKQPQIILVEPVTDANAIWRDPDHTATCVLISDEAQLSAQLTDMLLSHTADTAWLQTWQQLETHASQTIHKHADEVLWEGAVSRLLTTSLPHGAALHVASSMPIRDIDAFAPATTQHITVYCNRGVNGIDGTIASVLGLAHAWQNGPVFALVGDLAFLHDIASLQLAHQLRVTATVIVLNNHGGNIFSFLPIAQHPTAFHDYFLTPQQASIKNLCHATCCTWIGVDTLDALHDVLLEKYHQPGLRVIEISIDRDINHAQHMRIWGQAS